MPTALPRSEAARCDASSVTPAASSCAGAPSSQLGSTADSGGMGWQPPVSMEGCWDQCR